MLEEQDAEESFALELQLDDGKGEEREEEMKGALFLVLLEVLELQEKLLLE